MILALDPGRTTGWALSDGRNGTFNTEERDDGDHGCAISLFTDWLEELIDAGPLVCLAVERGYGGNRASGRLTSTMELVAHGVAWSRNVPRTDRSANEVRKYLLGFDRLSPNVGRSKADRVRMLDGLICSAVSQRGFRPENEHAADACALLCCVEQRKPREIAA